MVPPIFILTHGRSGSTLLRFLLDSHREVCCPAEIEIGKLSKCVFHTVDLTMGASLRGELEAAREAAVLIKVRWHIDEIMQRYCERKGKERWCDKSVSNIDHLGWIAKVFPDASHICLYRGCLDVVYSGIEAFRFGFPGRLAEFVARNPGNVVEALVESWCERTEALLAFEREHASRCFRIRYEDLVADPDAISAAMLSFLNLEPSPDIVRHTFSLAHDNGPGDWKIQFTSRVHSSMVGKGTTLIRHNISPTLRERMSRIMDQLGYTGHPESGRAVGAAFASE
jgi:protein-tyrosine sulfotransferase